MGEGGREGWGGGGGINQQKMFNGQVGICLWNNKMHAREKKHVQGGGNPGEKGYCTVCKFDSQGRQ